MNIVHTTRVCLGTFYISQTLTLTTYNREEIGDFNILYE